MTIRGNLIKLDYTSPFIIHVMKVKALVSKKPKWYQDLLK